MLVNREEAVYGNGRTMRQNPQGRKMTYGRGADGYGRNGNDGRMARGSNMQGGRGMKNGAGNPNGCGTTNGSRNPNGHGITNGCRNPEGYSMHDGHAAPEPCATGAQAMEIAAECGCVTDEAVDCGCVTNETADCGCVDYSDIPAENEAKLLAYIDEVSFCAYDVMLYLDTHPTDERAQEYFRKSNNKRDRAIDIYEEKYGPLRYGQTTVCGTGSVKWVTQSWPWEGGVC